MITRPYKLGMFLAQYLNQSCQLCQLHPVDANLVVSLSNNINVAKPHKAFKPFKGNWLNNNKLYNKGLLCSKCHQAIDWLPDINPLHITTPNKLTTHSTSGDSGTFHNTSDNTVTRVQVQAACYYQLPMSQAIRQFKFNEDMSQLPILVHALRQLSPPKGCHSKNSVILPMPTTGKRLNRRGFDPVSILAAYLSAYWHIPIWRGIERIDDTVSQRHLSKYERLSNLEGAFSHNDKTDLDANVSNILLFDDVMTTGASLTALAQALYLFDDSLQLSAFCISYVNF